MHIIEAPVLLNVHISRILRNAWAASRFLDKVPPKYIDKNYFLYKPIFSIEIT